MSEIRLKGKATIHRAADIQLACLDAIANAEDGKVNVDWAGALGLDSSVLQLLLAVAREKEICGTGEPSQAVRETLSIAGFDLSMKPVPTSSPE